MRSLRLVGAFAAAFLLSMPLGFVSPLSATQPQTADGDKAIIVLVHGLVLDLHQPNQIWGEPQKTGWSGMIGFLELKGLRFGGTIQPRLGRASLPDCLNTSNTQGDPRTAAVYVVNFSKNGNVDGLAYRTAELAECLEQLRNYTGARKVWIVAHSAGGVITRAYLQNVVPRIRYQGDVERLITIATPHLGSAAATYFGDLLGTRATCMKPNAGLIHDINGELDLPRDVSYASIVVRGLWRNVKGNGSGAYDKHIDRKLLDRLPLSYRMGGDELLHCKTQNLWPTPTAVRYEKATGKPIQYVAVRVPRIAGDLIHTSAPLDANVQEAVLTFLSPDGFLWTKDIAKERRTAWVQKQAADCAASIVEQETWTLHSFSGVVGTKLSLKRNSGSDTQHSYRFEAETQWRGSIIGVKTGKCLVSGSMDLEVDSFGRIVGVRQTIDQRINLPKPGKK